MDYLDKYISKWVDINFVKSTPKNKLINFLHIIVIIFAVAGLFLPRNLLFWYVLFLMLMLLSWVIFDGCPLTNVTNESVFVPISPHISDVFVFIFIILGIMQLLFPKLSFFNILYKIMTYLNDKYNKPPIK